MTATQARNCELGLLLNFNPQKEFLSWKKFAHNAASSSSSAVPPWPLS